MLICLKKELTEEVIKAIVERSPSHITSLDMDGWRNQMHLNILEILR